MVARLDRVYRLREGVLVLMELKTRRANRPYFSDVIELSAQRFALERHTGERVGRHAYVLVQQAGDRHRTPHRVRLLSDAAILALVARREALLAGQIVPRYAYWPALCRNCPFRQQCQPPLG